MNRKVQEIISFALLFLKFPIENVFLAALNYSTIITKNKIFQNMICFWIFGGLALIVKCVDMISPYKK